MIKEPPKREADVVAADIWYGSDGAGHFGRKLELECVDHDADGRKIEGKTWRVRIDGGGWFYGLERVVRAMGFSRSA